MATISLLKLSTKSGHHNIYFAAFLIHHPSLLTYQWNGKCRTYNKYLSSNGKNSFHLTRKVSRISNPRILAGWKAPLNIMLAWLRRLCLKPREQAYLYGGLLCFFLACACKAGVGVVIQTHRILSYPKINVNYRIPMEETSLSARMVLRTVSTSTTWHTGIIRTSSFCDIFTAK